MKSICILIALFLAAICNAAESVFTTTTYMSGAQLIFNSGSTIDVTNATKVGFPAAGISGSIANTQVAFGSGTNTVAGSNNLTWDNTNSILLFNGNYFRIKTNTGTDGFMSAPFGTNSFTNNMYYSGGWKRDQTGGAVMVQVGTSGTPSFGVSLDASGAAGSTFTPTNYITINQGQGIAFFGAAIPANGYVNTMLGYQINGTNIYALPAVYQGSFVTTAGTTSTTAVMAGFAGSITPATSGRIQVVVAGVMQGSVTNTTNVVFEIRYGTGAAPSHGTSPSGSVATSNSALGYSATANGKVPFTVTSIITGLTLGTTYWIDVDYYSGNSSSTALLSAAVQAHEI